MNKKIRFIIAGALFSLLLVAAVFTGFMHASAWDDLFGAMSNFALTGKDNSAENMYLENEEIINLSAVVSSTTAINDLAVNTLNGKYYDIAIAVSGIMDFTNLEITMQYNPAVLELVDLCSFTKEKELSTGLISSIGVIIENLAPGAITIALDSSKNITSGKTWSGVINVIRFKALQSGSTMVSVEGTGLVSPYVPTSIAFTQSSYSTVIPAAGSMTTAVKAQVKDQYGIVMNGCLPNYSLQNAYSGVSINSTTGVVTIQSSAAAGSVNVIASYGSLANAVAALNLSANTSIPTSVIFTESSYSATIPTSSNTNFTVTALVKDQFNIVINGFYPTYSLQSFHCGVSINSTTGVVTVQPGAMAGTVNIVASYGSITPVIVPLVLTNTINYTYYLYMKPEESNLAVGETLFLDIMLFGNLNYTQVAAKIAYDTAILEYAGNINLQGWSASVTTSAPNIVSVISVPSMNMIVGASCSPAIRIVTLKFMVLDGFIGDETDTNLSFTLNQVGPPGGMSGTTAPGIPVTVTI